MKQLDNYSSLKSLRRFGVIDLDLNLLLDLLIEAESFLPLDDVLVGVNESDLDFVTVFVLVVADFVLVVAVFVLLLVIVKLDDAESGLD